MRPVPNNRWKDRERPALDRALLGGPSTSPLERKQWAYSFA
jgi:hypothetical protein